MIILRISKIEITNFRLFKDFKLDFSQVNSVIIGQNDTGKTNLLFAIRKVLDFNIRREPLTSTDSTQNNEEDITIKIVMQMDNLSDIHRSEIGKYLETNNELHIKYYGVYNPDISMYEETITYGALDKFNFSTNRILPLDKILEIIYVNPLFNLSNDKKNYFNFRAKEDKENDYGLTKRMKEKIEELNENLSKDDTIKDMNKGFQDQVLFTEVFEDISFIVETDINTSNIYKSLDISNYQGSNKVGNIGDGKNKTLSLMLKYLYKKEDTLNIILVEEPENHLYPQMQRAFSNLIDELGFNQIITTTHSPYYLTYNKVKEIIKLNKNNNKITYKMSKITDELRQNYGFILNDYFSEMLFYDQVLLVEGSSELYFYNRLKIEDNDFNKYCTKNNFGIFSVNGIDFSPYYNFLSNLGIKVKIKTDNDIFKVPRLSPTEYRYAGIERVLDILSETSKQRLATIMNITEQLSKKHFRSSSSKIKIIEDNIDEIVSLLKSDFVYLNKHQDGFEQDFLEFVESDSFDDDLKFLKESKLKNLHFLSKVKDFNFKINENNKDSILVEFIND